MSNGDVAALQREIHAGIPLSSAMGFEITALSEAGITVIAPLSPNLNVHATGFAGSLYALGILTGWGLTRHLIRLHDLDAELVVAEAGIRYRAPVREAIQCRCEVPGPDAVSFVTQLRARRRARLPIEITIGSNGEAHLTATMAAKLIDDQAS